MKSKCQKNSLNPIFNECIQLPWDQKSLMKVHVDGYDEQKFIKSLGEVHLDLSLIDFSNGQIKKFKNVKLYDAPKGTITLSASFKPLLERRPMTGRLSMVSSAVVGKRVGESILKRRPTSADSFRLSVSQWRKESNESPKGRNDSLIRPVFLPSQLFASLNPVAEGSSGSETNSTSSDDAAIAVPPLSRKLQPNNPIDNSFHGVNNSQKFTKSVKNLTSVKRQETKTGDSLTEDAPVPQRVTPSRSLREIFLETLDERPTADYTELPRSSTKKQEFPIRRGVHPLQHGKYPVWQLQNILYYI